MPETFNGLDVLLIVLVIALAVFVRFAFKMARKQRAQQDLEAEETDRRVPDMGALLDATFREPSPQRERAT